MKKTHLYKLLFFLVFYYSFQNSTHAQDAYGFKQVDANYFGTSNLGAPHTDFQDVSINYNTGVGNINIPLYNISCGTLSLPISVFYVTSGIKADQPATDVGLGWNLEGGGSISRVIKGLPDEKFYLRTDMTTYQNDLRYNSLNQYLDKSYYSASYANWINTTRAIGKANECNDYTQVIAIDGGSPAPWVYNDVQPDLFTLNIPGKNINFVFDQNQQPVLLDNSHNIKITYQANSFTVLDENGIKYFFSSTDGEKTSSENTAFSVYDHVSGENYINFHTADDESGCGMTSPLFGFRIQDIITNWKLTKMETPDGSHSINFEYDTYNSSFISGATIAYNIDPSTNTKVSPFTLYQHLGNNPKTIGDYFDWNYISSKAKRLKKILWKTGSSVNGYVIFESNTQRTDVETNSFNKSLDYVKIFDNQNTELKRFKFNYSYFNSTITPPISYEAWRGKRLKLNSITEYSSDLIAKPNYIFDYDATSVPIKYTYEQDFWGYYNGNNATTMQGTLYHNSNYSNTNTTDFALWSPFCIYPLNLPGSGGGAAYSIINGANRLPNITYAKAGTLTKVTYPSSGSLSLEYESNTFCVDNDLTNRLAGGLRIKKTTIYDGINHSNDVIKNFYYTVNGVTLSGGVPKSSGKINFLPSLGYYTKYYNFLPPNHNVGTHINYYKITACNMASSTVSSESQVYYDEVKVDESANGYTVYKYNNYGTFGYNNDVSFSGSPMISKTKTETATWINTSGDYYNPTMAFTSNETMYRNTNHPYSPEPNIDWAVGELKEVLVCDASSVFKTKKIYNYEVKSFNKVHGYVTMPQYLLDNITTCTAASKFNYLSVWKVLKSETEFSYNNSSSPIVKTINYEYGSSNHKFVTAQSTVNSKGDIYRNEYTYVADCNLSPTYSAQDYPTMAFRKMKFNTHQLKAPIENTSFQIKNGVKYLLGGSLNLYKDFNNTLTSVPSPPTSFSMVESNNHSIINIYEKYAFETTSPVLISGSNYTPFSFGYNSSGSCYFSSYDNKYIRKLVCENYDAVGNAIQVKEENGLRASVIFGYNNNLPIASIMNASVKDCGFTSFESDDYLVFGNYAANIQNDGHSGAKSYLLPANTFGPGKDYMPSADVQNKKFIFSCWVKTNSNAAGAIGALVLYTNQSIGSGAIYPNVSGAYVGTAIYNTNNVWKYIEIEIDPKAVKIAAGLPLTTNLGIRSFVWNTGTTVGIQIDDLRFYPKEARMTTYTHNPLVGATSISDENNNSVFHEYDTFGRLKIVKDQNGKILEKTEYHYKP